MTPGYPPRIGGVERHVEVLANGAVDAALDVEVLTTDPSGRLAAADRAGGVLIRRFRTVRGSDVFYLSPRMGWWLLRHAGRFDLIHGHSYHAPLALLAAIAARIHRVPFIVTPHYHGSGHTSVRRLVHTIYRFFGAWMIRSAALVICNSEAECRLVRTDFGDDLPTAVILPGVEADDLIGAEPFDVVGKLILTGGRLETYKQVERAVMAMADLPSEYRLVIFGEGPARPSIEAAIRAGRLEDRVELVGRVSTLDLARWFRSATVFVSMSRKEAFGLTVLEAAAAGSAVVCSDIPAYRELVDRLPVGRVRITSVDAPPLAIARAIEDVAAATGGDTIGPLLPTWAAMVAGVVGSYATVLADRRSAAI
ncbi:MAG: glycosyltransferase family 4 protein [Chloroflexi bacterium]|nr:glycosyltransferase family 4 protein [Chloroflexota bacterium]